MYGNYSYGKRHLGRVIPTHNLAIKIGNPPPHPTIFSGPVTVAELKKRMEVDQIKFEKRMQNRKCLSEKNQNETQEISQNILPCSNEYKENVPPGEECVLKSSHLNNSLPPESNLCDSKDNSDCSNQTYTLDNSDPNSPSHLLNSTYDKCEEVENFHSQTDITQNPTPAKERKSAIIYKSNFRNYRQNRQDSMASEVYFNVNKTTDITQLTDTSANLNATNRSVLISFDNLKLDDECGNMTSMSMNVYKESPVAKILMDDKFSRSYGCPKKPKGKYFTAVEKSVSSRVQKSTNEVSMSKSPAKCKSVVESTALNKPTTPMLTTVRKSLSKNQSVSLPATPKTTLTRKSVSNNKTPSIPATPVTTPVRKSISKKKDDVSATPKSAQSRKSFCKDLAKIDNALKDSTVTLRAGSSVKRKLSHMNEQDELIASKNNSPVVRKSTALNKENISDGKTPSKMSSTWVTELKAENYLINTSLRDSTDSSGNRSTPEVFRKTFDEMWKPELEKLTEKELTTPFKSKLPQLKKTPNKYHLISSPVARYIHRGEGIQSMSKLRHSSCIHELTATSKSETKSKFSDSKNKPCRIPQRNASVHKKLNLPKMKKNETPLDSSSVSRISKFRN